MLQLNPVKERILFLSPVVQAGWEKEANINEFEILTELGSGAFGIVKKMKHKKSQIIYAIKLVNKAKLKKHGMIEQIKTEIKIMYSLSHENIIRLYNHFEDNENIYLVIEFAPGGQLWEKMHRSEGKRIPEKQVAMYIKELASALEYLHGKGVIHRDIKPENLLLDSKGHLKLADFGWSNFLNSNTVRDTLCGTPDYLSPEMLSETHIHDHMVDIWSCGVLIFELLSGKAPFDPNEPYYSGKAKEEITQENIINVKFEYPKDFPQLAKDLVSKILRKNPKTRIGVHDIKNHPWIKIHTQGTKAQIDPTKLIAEATFGQNMAQVKHIIKPDDNLQATFTEEEIMLYSRPDSLLDQTTQIKVEFVNKANNNIDQQVMNFKKQLGISSPSNSPSKGNSSNIMASSTPKNNTNLFTFSNISTNPSDQSNQLTVSYSSSTNKAPVITNKDDKKLKDQETENYNLKKEVKDLYQKINEAEAKQRKLELDCKSNEEKYKKFMEKPVSNNDGNLGEIEDLKVNNQNLKNQIKEQLRLISSQLNIAGLYDDEKQRLFESNLSLISVLELKQEYVEKLETIISKALAKRKQTNEKAQFPRS